MFGHDDAFDSCQPRWKTQLVQSEKVLQVDRRRLQGKQAGDQLWAKAIAAEQASV